MLEHHGRPSKMGVQPGGTRYVAFGALDGPGAIVGAIDAYAPGGRSRSYTNEAPIPGPLLSCTSAPLPARHDASGLEPAMSRGSRPCQPGEANMDERLQSTPFLQRPGYHESSLVAVPAMSGEGAQGASVPRIARRGCWPRRAWGEKGASPTAKGPPRPESKWAARTPPLTWPRDRGRGKGPRLRL